MPRRSLALCLVLLVGGVGAAVAWLATRGGGGATVVEPEAVAATHAADARRAEPLEAGALEAGALVAGTPSNPDPVAPTPDLREAIDAAPADAEPARAAPETTSLRVRVVDEDGAPVALYRLQLAVQDRAQRNAWSKEIAHDVQDFDGRASFDVRAGTWRVSVHADGYLDPRSASTWTHQTVVMPFFDGELPIVLRRASSLAGRVVGPSGMPVEGAEVRVVEAEGNALPFGEETVGPPATSDRQGRFELAALPPGQRSVTARADGWAPSAPVDVSLVAGERSEVELVLGHGGTLWGEVLHGGRRAADVGVAAFSTDARQVFEARTDAAGAFEISGLAPGEYQVIAEIDRPDGSEEFEFAHASVVEGERTHVVLGATSGDAVLVRGLVLREGVPAGGIDVVALREGSALFGGLAHAQVGVDGRFELELAGPGAYVFFADEAFETPIDVPAGPELALTLVISAGSIGGLVRGPSGPLADARVGLRSRSPLIAMRGTTWRETDGDGRYLFTELAPGTYSILADAAGFGRAALEHVALAPGAALDDAHFELAPGTRVSGRVVDADGRPLAGVTVHVQDERGALLASDDELRTDGAGRFTTDPLGPGTVHLLARAPGGVSPSVAARVGSGAAGIELCIAASDASAVIACSDAAGKPLRSTITVRDERGFDHVNLAMLDEVSLFERGFSTSTFTLEHLPPGRYTAEARAADGRSQRAELVLEAGEERRVELVLE